MTTLEVILAGSTAIGLIFAYMGWMGFLYLRKENSILEDIDTHNQNIIDALKDKAELLEKRNNIYQEWKNTLASQVKILRHRNTRLENKIREQEEAS